MARHPHPLTVLVVAEDEVTRMGLRLLLRESHAVGHVIEARGRKEAMALAETGAFDMVLVDACRSGAAGAYAAIDGIVARRPGTPLIIYTDDEEDVLSRCSRGHTTCYCSPRGPNSATQIAQIIEGLLAPAGGENGRSPPSPRGGHDATLVATLTARERLILSLVASGEGSREIASALGVSLRTIESNRARICAKLGVKSVAGLTKVAVKAGLASLDERPRELPVGSVTP